MKPLLLLLFMIWAFVPSQAQNSSSNSVKGCVIDGLSLKPLFGATVTLNEISDTTQVKLTYTGPSGNFVFNISQPGKFKLSVHFMGYASWSQVISIYSFNNPVLLDTIVLRSSLLVLKTVNVRADKPALKLKKDTLEFNAQKFSVDEHALAGELFKKLPGMEILPDGSITINGEKISKVMIDGRQFFDGDPKLIIRNLSADLVDLVQVIDRKPENTSGLPPPGKTEKVVNITTRKDRKENLTGYISAGGGTSGKYAGKVNVSRFSNSEQLTLIASTNNINDYQDVQPLVNDEGIRRNSGAGINYSKDWSSKFRLTTSYQFKDNTEKAEKSSTGINFASDSSFKYNSDLARLSKGQRHMGNFRLETINDTVNHLGINGSLSHQKNSGEQSTHYYAFTGSGQQAVRSDAGFSTDQNSSDFAITADYSRRLNSTGRLLSISGGIIRSNDDRFRTNRGINFFIASDSSIQADSIDIQGPFNQSKRELFAMVGYTEGFGRGIYLDLVYQFQHNYENSHLLYNRSNEYNGKYDIRIDSLSGDFNLTSFSHTPGISLRMEKKKWSSNISLYFQSSGYRLADLSQKQSYQYSFGDIRPSLFLSYQPSDVKRFQLNYFTLTQAPVLNQLQPLTDNTNPVILIKGNPALSRSYGHHLSLTYSAIKPARGESFSVNAVGSYTLNDFGSSVFYDSVGRQALMPVNLDGFITGNISIYKNFRLGKEFYLHSTTAIIWNKTPGLMEGLKYTSDLLLLSQGLKLTYDIPKVLSISTLCAIDYRDNHYGLEKFDNATFYTYKGITEASFHLPIGLRVGINVNFVMNTGRSGGFNQHFTLLNGYLLKSLFAGNATLKLQGFDLLKQNQSIIRTTGPNYFEDAKNLVLQRFFLLSFSWYFPQKGVRHWHLNENQLR